MPGNLLNKLYSTYSHIEDRRERKAQAIVYLIEQITNIYLDKNPEFKPIRLYPQLEGFFKEIKKTDSEEKIKKTFNTIAKDFPGKNKEEKRRAAAIYLRSYDEEKLEPILTKILGEKPPTPPKDTNQNQALRQQYAEEIIQEMKSDVKKSVATKKEILAQGFIHSQRVLTIFNLPENTPLNDNIFKEGINTTINNLRKNEGKKTCAQKAKNKTCVPIISGAIFTLCAIAIVIAFAVKNKSPKTAIWGIVGAILGYFTLLCIGYAFYRFISNVDYGNEIKMPKAMRNKNLSAKEKSIVSLLRFFGSSVKPKKKKQEADKYNKLSNNNNDNDDHTTIDMVFKTSSDLTTF